MAKIDNRNIVSTLNRADTVRAKTVDLLESCSQEVFDRPSSPKWINGEKGQWSLGEHADHILLVENYIRREIIEPLVMKSVAGEKPFIRKTLADFNLSPSFLPHVLLGPVEKMFDISNQITRYFVPRSLTEYVFRYSKFPASTPEPWAPTYGRLHAPVMSELKTSLDQLRALFEQHPDANYDGMIFEHTLIGRHTAIQLLRIVIIHEEWHQDRIQEVLRDCSRAGNAP